MFRTRSRKYSFSPGSSWGEAAAFEEAMRVLRSNLMVALTDIDRPSVAVTSAHENEGKTMICANLAMSFAAAGRRTVLVDLDLRHPNAHVLVGAHNDVGASEVLLGQRKLEDAMQFIELRNGQGPGRSGLYFLPTGNELTDPTELLGSGRTGRLLERLSAQADLVLIDTPPVLPIADTLIIGRLASGAILVTEARRTAFAAVQKTKDLLIRNRTRLLGVVLNKFQAGDVSYGYGYGYGNDDNSYDTMVPELENREDDLRSSANGHVEP